MPMTCPAISYRTKWPILLLWMLALVVVANAQTTAQVRSATRDGGTLTVHVELARGQTINRAALLTDSGEITLTAEPVTLPVDRWILLDGGANMVNNASSVQAAIERFIRGIDADNQAGLVIYRDDVSRYLPTANETEFNRWLSEYNADAAAPGCVGDALGQLADLPPPTDRARRVLIIAADLSRQGLCTLTGYQDTGAPVDVLLISETPSDTYLDIVERSGGTLYRANIRTLEERLNEVQSAWANPVYRLQGDANGPIEEDATLQLALANQQTQQIPLRLRVLQAEATAAPGLVILPGATDAPTVPPLPTQPDTAPATVLPATVAAVVPTDAAPPTADDALPTATVLPATVAAVVLTDAAPPNDAGGVAQIPTDAPTTAAPSRTPTSPPPAPAPDTLTQLRTRILDADPLVQIGSGLVMLATVALFILLMAMRRTPAPSVPAADDPYMDDETVLDRGSTQTAIEVPNTMPAPTDTELTEMLSEDDIIANDDRTEVITEEELLASEPIAHLYVADTATVYDICPPSTRLGRDPDNDIIIDNLGRQLSRHHFRFDVENGVVWLTVLTGNATLLNGQTASQDSGRLRLSTDDVLTVTSAYKLIFRYLADETQ